MAGCTEIKGKLSTLYFSSDCAALRGICASHGFVSVFAVADREVLRLHPEVRRMLQGIPVLEIEALESGKTFAVLEQVVSFLLENGADRSSLVLCIGGGLISDLAGFAASVYRRGIAYANVPTTLLSQVDASIGGKTGLNFNSCKNMVGTVRQPVFTFICPRFLETLPDAELRSGFAELVKTALIADRNLYGKLCGLGHFSRLRDADESRITELLSRACAVKMRIVEEDPEEHGLRRILNFGHTYGHAIERFHLAQGHEIAHGDAVSAGMTLALKVSCAEGLISAEETQALCARLPDFGLVTECGAGIAELNALIACDKKCEGEQIWFVMLEKAGQAVARKMNIDNLKRICTTFR